MMTASRTQPGPLFPAAAIFDAPGRPRPMARRLAIHNRVVRSIRTFFLENAFHEIPVTALADDPARVQLDGMLARGFEAVWCESEIMPRAGKLEPRHLRGFKLMEAAFARPDLDALSEVQERLLKAVAGDLSADLLGGRHVTRLDRMLRSDHPRLRYRDAVTILADKGWSLAFDDPLPPQARATLTRHCGNLPYQLTHLPLGQRPDATIDTTDAEVGHGLEYVLPYAGVTLEGELGAGPAATPRARFDLDLGRLLQYLMGLENITDTLIDPMDRIVGMMKDVSPGTGRQRKGGAG